MRTSFHRALGQIQVGIHSELFGARDLICDQLGQSPVPELSPTVAVFHGIGDIGATDFAEKYDIEAIDASCRVC